MAPVTVGRRVMRKRDGAMGTVVNRVLGVPSVTQPGVYGKLLVSVRLDDAALVTAVGGDMTGDLGWLRSNFKVVRA